MPLSFWEFFLFWRKWKVGASGFGKVVHLKGIVNVWQSNGWGCGEPSIRTPRNEVRIKANVYLLELFCFWNSEWVDSLPTIHCDKKGPFLHRGERLVAERHLVFLLWWRWHFGECFCQRWSFDDSYCSAPPDAGKTESTFLMSLCGIMLFCPRCTASPRTGCWVTWPFASVLVTRFMIKKGQVMGDRPLCFLALLCPHNFITSGSESTETALQHLYRADLCKVLYVLLVTLISLNSSSWS